MFTHQWPNAFADASTVKDEIRESYKQGDSILIYRETTESVQTLTMPAALVGVHCHINLPMRFLVSSQSSICLRSSDEHNAFVRHLQQTLHNTKLLKSRRGIGNNLMISELCGLSIEESANTNNCQSIHIYECVSSLTPGNCNRLNETDYEIDSSLHNQLIVYEFVHNFTNILNGSVYFLYTIDTGRLDRSIEVRFRQMNEMRVPHHIVSGNLGYELGKPIIVSYWTKANASDDHSPIIANYFHVNNSRHDNQDEFLRIPIFRGNECQLDDSHFETIGFGQDIYVKCEVRLDRNLTKSPTTNLTQLCINFQSTIFTYILRGIRQADDQVDYSNVETIVSAFGNPANESDQWTKLMNSADEMAVVGLIDGNPEDGGFRCRNIVLSVSYEFDFARLSVQGNPHQNVLKSAKLRAGRRVDLKFGWDEVWRVPVFVDGIFVDLTGAAVRRLGSISLLIVCHYYLCMCWF